MGMDCRKASGKIFRFFASKIEGYCLMEYTFCIYQIKQSDFQALVRIHILYCIFLQNSEAAAVH